MNFSSIPVIYYHSVKKEVNQDWVHPNDILELEKFEKHLRFFKSLGTKTFDFDELELHLKGERRLPLKSLGLTFDDGYLDNFVFVFPLLKKYKLKATFWIVPDFVDKSDFKIRPTLEDYWSNKVSLNELNSLEGYINWEEMRLMEESGLVDIQSHTLTHTRYPVSEKIIDFVNPDTKIDWLYWNLYKDDKPNFLSRPRHKIPLGYPIYESEKGLIAIKCEENGLLTSELINHIKKNGNERFFDAPNWKSQLFSISESLKKNANDMYRKENEEEYTNRVKIELKESKQIIEEELGKRVNHVCWPFGGCNEKTIELADYCGYRTNTAKGQKNVFNKNLCDRVDRIALDNPKYQNTLFYPYAIYKLFDYKL